MRMNAKQAEYLIQQLRVLLVEDNPFMRNLVRNMLANIGVKKVYEAGDGIAGLELIRSVMPDVMVLDWEMPLLNGPELVRIVRSPGLFPLPDILIIMLTAHGERWRVTEAARLGVNEFLCKPVSAKRCSTGCCRSCSSRARASSSANITARCRDTRRRRKPSRTLPPIPPEPRRMTVEPAARAR